LEEFVDECRKATDSRLRIPDYAGERAFWISSAGATPAEIATALADLWGWEASSSRSGTTLGRPSFGRPNNGAELHEAMGRAIPPAVWNSVRNHEIRRDRRRVSSDLARIFRWVQQRAGPDEAVSMSQLSESERRCVAAAVLEQQALTWGRVGQQPSVYVAQPQLMSLSLRPARDPQHDHLFWVEAIDGSGRMSGWGVGVPAIK
jgi:hypothetical protein